MKVANQYRGPKLHQDDATQEDSNEILIQTKNTASPGSQAKYRALPLHINQKQPTIFTGDQECDLALEQNANSTPHTNLPSEQMSSGERGGGIGARTAKNTYFHRKRITEVGAFEGNQGLDMVPSGQSIPDIQTAEFTLQQSQSIGKKLAP